MYDIANRQDAFNDLSVEAHPFDTLGLRKTAGGSDGLAPCSAACPAAVEVPAVMGHIRQGRLEEALDTLLLENPFPSLCGRLCFQNCEDACLRAGQDEAVSIRDLERNAGDFALEDDFRSRIRSLPGNGKRLALFGDGPTALSAAYFLNMLGFSCDLFESADHLGDSGPWQRIGRRLPRQILEKEVSRIKGMGTAFHWGDAMTPEDVRQRVDNYDGVVVGSAISRDLISCRLAADPESSLHTALQTDAHPRHIELGNVTMEIGEKPVIYGGGWYTGIHSISHAVGCGKTAAIALHAFFDGGIEAVLSAVADCRVGCANALSMEIYILGERSHGSRELIRAADVDRSGYAARARMELPETGLFPSSPPGHVIPIHKDVSWKPHGVNPAVEEARRCYGCGHAARC